MGDESSECIFLNKRNAFGDVETYPGLKTEPQWRMHVFRFTNRFLQLTSASEQLLELLMGLLLLNQFSCGRGVLRCLWHGGRVRGPLYRAGLPRAQNLGLTGAENAPASDSSLSSSSSSSCSEALVAEGDL